LITNNGIRGDPAPGLKSLNRGFGIGAEVAIDCTRRGVLLAGCSIGNAAGEPHRRWLRERSSVAPDLACKSPLSNSLSIERFTGFLPAPK
jgi:hypothetical protein